jgi:hypothetical protein
MNQKLSACRVSFDQRMAKWSEHLSEMTRTKACWNGNRLMADLVGECHSNCVFTFNVYGEIQNFVLYFRPQRPPYSMIWRYAIRFRCTGLFGHQFRFLFCFFFLSTYFLLVDLWIVNLWSKIQFRECQYFSEDSRKVIPGIVWIPFMNTKIRAYFFAVMSSPVKRHWNWSHRTSVKAWKGQWG